jgi:hypothetical protein
VWSGIVLLACIDGSEEAIRALRYALRRPIDRIVLLYVAARPSAGHVECGRMALEAAIHRCGLDVEDSRVRCRLEVGERAARLLAACGEERPDVVVMGSRIVYPAALETEALEVPYSAWAECAAPVLLASRRGIELLAGAERVLIVPRGSRGGSEERGEREELPEPSKPRPRAERAEDAEPTLAVVRGR